MSLIYPIEIVASIKKALGKWKAVFDRIQGLEMIHVAHKKLHKMTEVQRLKEMQQPDET